MECTQRLECTQELYETHTERVCPEQVSKVCFTCNVFMRMYLTFLIQNMGYFDSKYALFGYTSYIFHKIVYSF